MFKNVSRKLKKDQRGLTLVELLAVVVILAIVSAIAFVLIGNVIENSKKDSHIANAQQAISAVKLAEASGDVTETQLTSGFNAVQLKTLAEVLEPWGKTKYTEINVLKSGSTYSIVSTVPATSKCPITTKTEAQLQQGRAVACP